MSKPLGHDGLGQIPGKVCVFQSAYFAKLGVDGGYKTVSQWINKQHGGLAVLLSNDVIFFVVHLDDQDHWQLIAIVNPTALVPLLADNTMEEDRDQEFENGDEPVSLHQHF